jgi:hypothetical protein
MLKGIGFLALALLPPQILLQLKNTPNHWLARPYREKIKGPKHNYLDGGENYNDI